MRLYFVYLGIVIELVLVFVLRLSTQNYVQFLSFMIKLKFFKN